MIFPAIGLWISGYWDAFWGWVGSALGWLVSLLVQVFVDLFEMAMDLFLAVLEVVFSLVLLLVQGLGALPGAEIISQTMDAIPPGWWLMTTRLHIPEAMGIVLSAVVVRFLLQLIPFVRLGS